MTSVTDSPTTIPVAAATSGPAFDFGAVVAVLRRHDALPATAAAALVGGSIARGWANPLSDVDIAVLTTDEAAAARPPVVFDARGRRWEVKTWSLAHVEAMVASLGWDAFDPSHNVVATLSWDEQVLLERLCSGVAAYGADVIARLRAGVRDGALGALVVARALDDADGLLDDALGQAQADDLDSAVLSARLAFGHTVDAVLASCHEYVGPEKWRARRMRLVASPALPFDEYWAVETMRDLDPAAPGAWVDHVVRLCRRVARAVSV